jgi:hypothetical protein
MKRCDGRNFQDTEDQLNQKERRVRMVGKTWQVIIGLNLARKVSARTILET